MFYTTIAIRQGRVDNSRVIRRARPARANATDRPDLTKANGGVMFSPDKDGPGERPDRT
jgi:hypothetical protein